MPMGGAQRRLSDLRKTRAPLRFEGEDDDGPFDIEVWVVKLNDADMNACIRAGDAAKARVLLSTKDRDSEVWQAAYGQVVALGDEPEILVEYLSHYYIAENGPVIEAEVAGGEDSEWAKDNYLDGLYAAWRGDEGDLGLQLAYQARDDDPDTVDPEVAELIPEAIRVFAELNRYQDAVSSRIDADRARFIREHEHLDMETLRRRAVDRFLDSVAAEAWNQAFKRSRILYATREFSDYKKRYFANLAEVDDVAAEFRAKISAKYDDIAVGGIEGKSSQGPQSSSPRSGSSGEEETLASSGPPASTG